ncbi:hypothetical protein ACQ3JU_0575 (plasmid) [Bradyrhizobium guangxiense]
MTRAGSASSWAKVVAMERKSINPARLAAYDLEIRLNRHVYESGIGEHSVAVMIGDLLCLHHEVHATRAKQMVLVQFMARAG